MSQTAQDDIFPELIEALKILTDEYPQKPEHRYWCDRVNYAKRIIAKAEENA